MEDEDEQESWVPLKDLVAAQAEPCLASSEGLDQGQSWSYTTPKAH